MQSLCSLLELHSLSSQRMCVGIELLRANYVAPNPNGQLKLKGMRRYKNKRVIITACNSSSVNNNDSEESNISAKATTTSSDQSEAPKSNGGYLKKPELVFQQLVAALPPSFVAIRKQAGGNLILGFCVAAACMIVVVRVFVSKGSREKRPGTVNDLVRRGQLRSDRRGISEPLKYEDPFNNPLVKAKNGNSTVEMCGKVYRMAPITLTEEQRAVHQKRRSRAYQWTRPEVYLKEGDPVPPDVDPDTVRWIPANHPFATTDNDLDEDLAQNNVYQKHGVPFRIQAEHEALQKKLEALQSEQKFSKLVIDPVNAKDFERSLKSQLKPHEQPDDGTHNGQASDCKPPKSDQAPETFDGNT